MKVHRIDLVAVKHGAARMFYNGQSLGVSHEPILSASRKLLALGRASPGDKIETYRGETPVCHSTVGAAAALTIVEDGRGIRFQKYSLPTLKRAA
jgi:hypothetical protein